MKKMMKMIVISLKSDHAASAPRKDNALLHERAACVLIAVCLCGRVSRFTLAGSSSYWARPQASPLLLLHQ